MIQKAMELFQKGGLKQQEINVILGDAFLEVMVSSSRQKINMAALTRQAKLKVMVKSQKPISIRP
jgi:hypothetical protein